MMVDRGPQSPHSSLLCEYKAHFCIGKTPDVSYSAKTLQTTSLSPPSLSLSLCTGPGQPQEGVCQELAQLQ